MPIDLRSLRYFVAIVSAGSISKAAECLHIAQPALSVHIKEMERELGAQLLDRSPKGIAPTAAGLSLLSHAQDILRRIEIAYHDVRDSNLDPGGRVAIGMPQSMAKILAVPLIRTVVRQWPNIRLQLTELSSNHIPQHLLGGSLDIGMTFLHGPQPGLRFSRLLEEELIVVGAPGRFFDKLDCGDSAITSVDASALQGLALILPAANRSLRMLIESFRDENALDLNVIAEANSIHQLIDLAKAGIGCTILSYAAVKDSLDNHSVSAARIVNPHMVRPVFLCRSAVAPASIATTSVQELIAATVRTMVDQGGWPTRVG